jgi:predicted nucleotidyltransferase
MSDQVGHPTPYADVNAVLQRLLTDVQAVLGSEFIGMYLYGSLASGDFDQQTSDIDFVVVTAHELPDDLIAALGTIHDRLAASGLALATKLEGSYLPLATLRRYDPSYRRFPSINEGRFWVCGHGNDWVIQRHILREQGVVVAGPDLRPLIDPLHPDALRQAVLDALDEWWWPMLDDPERISTREYQVFAVLTMCRALHTLQHGVIVSKPVAARWAQSAFGPSWAALIKRALVWRPGMPGDELSETLDFLRFARERSRQSQAGL